MTDGPGGPPESGPPGAPGALRLVTLAERPDLRDRLGDHNGAAWPEFMLQDPVADRLWHHLDEDFAAWQLMLLDADDRIVAAGNSAPLAWDGSDDGLPAGWDDQFERTVAGLRAGTVPNTLGALQIVVAPGRQGEGLAGRMIEIFRERGRAAGLGALIACVRPTEKHRYPLTPIERYAAWTREDGLPFDAWIRLHVRLGARVVRAAPESMTITGTVADWERWTGLAFPDSGAYVIPFVTNPIVVDRGADRIVYHDANVWMVHDPA
jgi:GNAT superfamily N-acetyltransferase